MKTSNKILWVTAIGIFVAIPVVVGIAALNTSAEQPGGLTTQELALQNFHHVIMSGTWDVKIVAGDHYRVEIAAPKTAAAKYAAMQNGDTIEISNSGFSDQNHWMATVVLPQLSSVELRGTDNAEISGFHVTDLSIRMDGTHSLSGVDNQIENLKLHASGTSSIDLSASQITNADVEIDGTSNTKLNMQGGDLTGQAHGSVAISYSGMVKSQTVNIAGIAKVNKTG